MDDTPRIASTGNNEEPHPSRRSWRSHARTGIDVGIAASVTGASLFVVSADTSVVLGLAVLEGLRRVRQGRQ